MNSPVPDPVEGPKAFPVVPEPLGAAPPSARTSDRGSRAPRRFTRSESPALVLLAVFAAGMLGTAARLGIDALLPAEPSELPLSTLLINTLGSFALGLVAPMLNHAAPEWLRAAVTTGLLGSFTTFSAITVAAVALGGAGGLLEAAILLVASVVTGLAAAVVGIALGATIVRRRA